MSASLRARNVARCGLWVVCVAVAGGCGDDTVLEVTIDFDGVAFSPSASYIDLIIVDRSLEGCRQPLGAAMEDEVVAESRGSLPPPEGEITRLPELVVPGSFSGQDLVAYVRVTGPSDGLFACDLVFLGCKEFRVGEALLISHSDEYFGASGTSACLSFEECDGGRCAVP